MKREFFQAVAVSVLLYGYTNETLSLTDPGSSTLQNSCCTASYYPSHKTSNTCWRNNDDLILDVLLYMPTHRHTSKNLNSSALHRH